MHDTICHTGLLGKLSEGFPLWFVRTVELLGLRRKLIAYAD